MSAIHDRHLAESAWRQLLGSWEELDDDDPQTWRKSSSMATFFITETDGNGFDFTIQGGDDEVIIEDQRLEATELEAAMCESDNLIAEFFSFGSAMLKSAEIRIKQAFVLPEPGNPNSRFSDVGILVNSIMAVGEDGVLYYFNGKEWEPRSMLVKTSAQ